MSEETKLKTCPFCGSEPSWTKFRENYESYSISCEGADCPAGPVVVENSRSDAADAWNTRAALTAAGVKPRVKPLVWLEKDFSPGAFYVASAVGPYHVYPNGHWTSPLEHHQDQGTVTTAKAAAQADYEARILSALTTEGE